MVKILIKRAYNEDDVTHYALYWGADKETKLPGHPAIVFLPKTGKDIQYAFPKNFQIPSETTAILTFTRNFEAEMRYGTSANIIATTVDPVPSLVIVQHNVMELTILPN